LGNAETKKHASLDAFAIQALSEWAESNDLEMLVVPDDSIIQDACQAASRLNPTRNLGKVLDHVASDDEQLATFLPREIAPV
jgi:hypothetical protein